MKKDWKRLGLFTFEMSQIKEAMIKTCIIMKGREKVDCEPLFFLSYNTRANAYLMKQEGNTFKTDKRKYFFIQNLSRTMECEAQS